MPPDPSLAAHLPGAGSTHGFEDELCNAINQLGSKTSALASMARAQTFYFIRAQVGGSANGALLPSGGLRLASFFFPPTCNTERR